MDRRPQATCDVRILPLISARVQPHDEVHVFRMAKFMFSHCEVHVFPMARTMHVLVIRIIWALTVKRSWYKSDAHFHERCPFSWTVLARTCVRDRIFRDLMHPLLMSMRLHHADGVHRIAITLYVDKHWCRRQAVDERHWVTPPDIRTFAWKFYPRPLPYLCCWRNFTSPITSAWTVHIVY